MRRVVLVAVLAACGSEDGQPISGDVAFSIDDDIILPTTGAAIRDTETDKELIVIGTRDISCSTTLGSPLRKGTYATIRIDRLPPGNQPSVEISIIRVTSSATQINGDVGAVMIDQLDDRVTGSLVFETTDDTDGVITTLGVSGSFDVVNCAP